MCGPHSQGGILAFIGENGAIIFSLSSKVILKHRDKELLMHDLFLSMFGTDENVVTMHGHLDPSPSVARDIRQQFL